MIFLRHPQLLTIPLRANEERVCRALESDPELGLGVLPTRVLGAIITYYPTVASYFIPDFPCVSLSEVMSSWATKQCWPY